MPRQPSALRVQPNLIFQSTPTHSSYNRGNWILEDWLY
jgi:hypothetical protein